MSIYSEDGEARPPECPARFDQFFASFFPLHFLPRPSSALHTCHHFDLTMSHDPRAAHSAPHAVAAASIDIPVKNSTEVIEMWVDELPDTAPEDIRTLLEDEETPREIYLRVAVCVACCGVACCGVANEALSRAMYSRVFTASNLARVLSIWQRGGLLGAGREWPVW